MPATVGLNIERFEDLLHYLWDTGRMPRGAAPVLTRLEGGVSNRTVLVEPTGARAFVLKQALERLRVKTDWHSDPRRIEREALGLEWLERLAPPETITPLLFLDKAQHLLAMEAVPRPHTNWKVQLLEGIVDARHVEQFGHLLAAVHRRSNEQAEAVATVFDDRTFFETLRLEPYYRYTASRVPEAGDFLSQLIDQTTAHRLALVHGDYSPKNILIREGRLVLLDHEVIHFGDPTFDVGFSLTHFLSKAHHLAAHREAFVSATQLYWRTYHTAVGDLAQSPGFESRVVRHTLACLLARVEGRSPLEYLNPQERRRQRDIALALIRQGHRTAPALLEGFQTALR